MIVMLVGFLACAPVLPSDKSAETIVRAAWKPMEPPRRGLRCWYSQLPDYGVSYCEADPNTTFGASQ